MIICVCIGLTFLPIIVGFAAWVGLEGWNLVSYLNYEEIRSAVVFISIADLSMIVGVILVLLGYGIFNNKIDVRFSSTTIINWLAISTTIGLLFDCVLFYREWLPFWLSYNFTITFPSFLLSLIIAIHLFRITDTASIKWCSVILSVLFMIVTFGFYEVKAGGAGSEFFGLVYFIGFVPALIVGYIYGLYLSDCPPPTKNVGVAKMTDDLMDGVRHK